MVDLKRKKKPVLFGRLNALSHSVGVDLFGRSTLLMRAYIAFLLAASSVSLFQQLVNVSLADGLEARTEPLSTSIIVLVYLSKFLCVRLRLGDIHSIFNSLRDLTAAQVEDPKKEAILLRAERNVRTLSNFFTFVNWFTHGTLILNTALHNAHHPDDLKIPLNTWFPFEVESTSLRFNLAFIWVSVSLSFVTQVALALRVMFSAIAMYTAAQMRVLQEDLGSFGDVIARGGDVNGCMVKIVVHHNAIIKLVDHLNRVFSFAQFLEVVLSSAQFCLIAYLCSKTGILDPKIRWYLPLLFGCISSLFLISYMGQIIIDESLNINEKAYQIPWDDLDTSARRKFLRVLHQSSRPLKVQYRAMFTMDMPIFLSSLQSAYSLMAIVNSMVTED